MMKTIAVAAALASALSIGLAVPAAADASDRRLVTSVVLATFDDLTYSEQLDICRAWDFSHAMAYRELKSAFAGRGFSQYDIKRGIYVAFSRAC